MIIVDTSVVYKWFVDEDEQTTRPARVLRDRYIHGEESVTAPDILLYEIANIIANKARLSEIRLQRAWKSFLELEISVVLPTMTFVGDCLKLSRKYHISVYDAAYIVLAQQKHCLCMTADEKLVKRVNLPFVRSIKDYQP